MLKSSAKPIVAQTINLVDEVEDDIARGKQSRKHSDGARWGIRHSLSQDSHVTTIAVTDTSALATNTDGGDHILDPFRERVRRLPV